MPKDTPEYTYSEKPTIDQLVMMGWQHITGDREVPQFTERETFKQVLLVDRLKSAIERINVDDSGNQWLDEERVNAAIANLERIAQTPRLIEANQAATELLLQGAMVEGQDGKNIPIDYIDFDRPDNNDFLVINQFRVDPAWSNGDRGYIIPDLVLFVNGIPLVTIECKSPNLQNPLIEAITDLLKYSNQRNKSQPEGAERLFCYNLLMVAASQHRAAAGAVGASYGDYVEWKDTSPKPTADIASALGVSELNSRQMLIAGMLDRANLLDIFYNFTLFKSSGGRTIKIVPRYQQYRAIYKTIDRLQHNQTRSQHGTDDQRGGIIWHTQGSGKSLTMVYLVRKLRTNPALRRFKVVIVTDRTDLEKQLSGTAILSGEPLQKAKNVKQLEKLLANPGADLIFGMIQKFRGDSDVEAENDEPMANNLNPSEDILVLIDEAHRSHSNTFQANLQKALPNCIRIGFTGTPIVKREKNNTLKIFGSWIDRYTIRESQDDKVTVPILYEGLEARATVEQGDDLDRLFEIVFKDKTPAERAEIKQKYATKSEVSEALEPIAAKAQDMLRHYIKHILPNGFKAQLVASSRLAAVRYYQAMTEAKNTLVQQLETRAAVLDSLDVEALAALDPETQFLGLAYPQLETIRRLDFAPIISADKDDDPQWSQWTSKSNQDAYTERFKKPLAEDGMAFLIVKNMLLTGFDAAVEQVMYLDRGMKDYELLQAIARVNRTHPQKDYGLIVDYYGVNIPAALAIYDELDIDRAWFDLREELPKVRDRHQRTIALFTDENCKISDLEACVDLLRDEKLRVKFTERLKDFLDSLDTVLPRADAVPFVADAKQLGLIRKSVADLYRDEKLNLVDAKAKVRALIDQYIRSQGIDPKIEPIDILALDFKAQVQRHRSTKSQAAEMEYAAKHHISIHIEEDPVYYQKLSERLDLILQTLADNWEAQVAALKEYIQDIQQGRPGDETGLDPRKQLPFLSLIAEASQRELPDLAKATIEIVDHICTTIRRVRFWENLVAQGELRNWIVLYLDDNDIVPFECQESVADKLVQLARHKHETLMS